MKRLIIFADGTWNSPANKDGTSVAQTNVYRSFVETITDICDNGDEQIAYYQEGVGTGNSANRLKGGLLGEGIDNNIKDLYEFIVDNYTPGTEIFLFGFSRGSYTVRSLAGLIRNCGILKRYNARKVDRAYYIYRSKDDKYHPNSGECIEFQKHFSYPLEKTPIKFIGVWDTVGSLGVPFKLFNFSANKYRFHDVKLSFLIQNAYHAISLNENRVFFRPTLWRQEQGEFYKDQVLEQCWFRGVHSDIGGGYFNSKLCEVPLHYLVERAKKHGLQTNYSATTDQLQEAALSNQNESWQGFYRAFPRYYRNVNNKEVLNEGLIFKFNKWLLKLIIRREDSSGGQLPTNEFIHQSVIDYYNKHSVPSNMKTIIEELQSNGRIISYN